jgi:hypothetical protein
VLSPKPLPAATIAEVIARWPYYRQSLLAKMDNCPLSARFDLEARPYTNHAQARGIVFHRYAAEVLRTLRRTGNSSIPEEEAMQILYEVSRQRDLAPEDRVTVPARERRLLRICALSLANVPLHMDRLVAVEDRLFADVGYALPGGGSVTRQISGQPDALLADPPHGAIVLDWKTAPSAPAAGDQPHWTGDHLHVSYEGYFQQRFYALLVMRNYPAVQQVILREYYVLPRETREAVVPREALEHIEHELSLIVEALDCALGEGRDSPLWHPSPGLHCGYCAKPTSCPLDEEVKLHEKAITSATQAGKVAAMVAVIDRIRESALPAMKAWHERTGHPIAVKDAKGRHEWRWSTDSKGKRRFKLCTPDRSVQVEDQNLERALEESLAQVEGEAAHG